MKKKMNSNDIIELIQDKIKLKKELRIAKKTKQLDESEKIVKKIAKIEDKLLSQPLAKV
jgi:hypothetical protein